MEIKRLQLSKAMIEDCRWSLVEEIKSTPAFIFFHNLRGKEIYNLKTNTKVRVINITHETIENVETKSWFLAFSLDTAIIIDNRYEVQTHDSGKVNSYTSIQQFFKDGWVIL